MNELAFHGIQTGVLISIALVVIPFCIKALRAFGRFENTLKNYPPHLHINGDVLYPDGYEPPVRQRVFPKDHGASAS